MQTDPLAWIVDMAEFADRESVIVKDYDTRDEIERFVKVTPDERAVLVELAAAAAIYFDSGHGRDRLGRALLKVAWDGTL